MLPTFTILHFSKLELNQNEIKARWTQTWTSIFSPCNTVRFHSCFNGSSNKIFFNQQAGRLLSALVNLDMAYFGSCLPMLWLHWGMWFKSLQNEEGQQQIWMPRISKHIMVKVLRARSTKNINYLQLHHNMNIICKDHNKRWQPSANYNYALMSYTLSSWPSTTAKQVLFAS